MLLPSLELRNRICIVVIFTNGNNSYSKGISQQSAFSKSSNGAREPQQIAFRKWVVFTNPRHRKSPVLRNRESRIRSVISGCQTKLVVVKHSS